MASLKRIYTAAFAALLVFAAAGAFAAEIPGPEQQHIFVGGVDGYHTYRIPAMIVTQKGTVLTIVEARKNSSKDYGDIDLVYKRSEDGGRTWGPMTMIYDSGEQTVGNPAPVQDRDTGRIWLPFCIDNDTVWVTYSDDDGVTWSSPREITKDVKPAGWTWYATGPGHSIQLRTGRLLVACDHKEDGKPHSHIIYSDDHGATWKLGGSLPKATDESTALELSDGSVYINMRNNYMRKMRAYARSTDGGLSFSKIKFDRELQEPVCEGSVVRYTLKSEHGKSRVLFSNPASVIREKMTVKMSYDEARSWPVAKLIFEGKSAYSDITVLKDMDIGLIYENGDKGLYDRITFARFSLEWLTGGEDGIK